MPLSALLSIPPQTNPHRKLTNEQAAQLQREYRVPGVTTAQLGRKYGVTQQTAHRIATGRLYSDLPTWGPKLHWKAPKVHTAGMPETTELRTLILMLQVHCGRWALVKRTPRRSALKPWRDLGLMAELRKEATGWGVWVCWPEAQAGASVA